jgi:hypothetical protein
MVGSEQQETVAEPTQVADQEWLRKYMDEHQGELAPGATIEPAEKKSNAAKIMLVLAVVAMGGLALFSMKGGGLSLSLPGKPAATLDLGQGVSNDTGLRGHLVVHWPDKSATYGLKIEPIDGRDSDGFLKVVDNTTQPVFINAHLLDRDGSVLCDKQIELTPNEGKGAPSGLPAGTDVFKRLPLKNGGIDGLWAEGALPCSADQYRKADYWSFTTNFPTTAAQDKLMGRKSPVVVDETPKNAPRQNDTMRGGAIRNDAQQTVNPERAAAATRPRQPKKVQSLYFMQGDDQVTAYE